MCQYKLILLSLIFQLKPNKMLINSLFTIFLRNYTNKMLASLIYLLELLLLYSQ